jgi:hypothetical protein
MPVNSPDRLELIETRLTEIERRLESLRKRTTEGEVSLWDALTEVAKLASERISENTRRISENARAIRAKEFSQPMTEKTKAAIARAAINAAKH